MRTGSAEVNVESKPRKDTLLASSTQKCVENNF